MPLNNISKFKFWCYRILPLVYDDSISYYEFLCKVMEKLNEIIDDVNALNEEVARLDRELVAEIQRAIAEEQRIETKIDGFYDIVDALGRRIDTETERATNAESALGGRQTITEQKVGTLELLVGWIENVIRNSNSDVYNPANEYEKGDYCLYPNSSGNLYKCLEDTTGSWDSTKWVQTTIISEMGNAGSNLDDIVGVNTSAYDETNTYNENEICVYNNKMYIAKENDITGSWDSSKWRETDVINQLDVGEGVIQTPEARYIENQVRTIVYNMNIDLPVTLFEYGNSYPLETQNFGTYINLAGNINDFDEIEIYYNSEENARHHAPYNRADYVLKVITNQLDSVSSDNKIICEAKYEYIDGVPLKYHYMIISGIYGIDNSGSASRLLIEKATTTEFEVDAVNAPSPVAMGTPSMSYRENNTGSCPVIITKVVGHGNRKPSAQLPSSYNETQINSATDYVEEVSE